MKLKERRRISLKIKRLIAMITASLLLLTNFAFAYENNNSIIYSDGNYDENIITRYAYLSLEGATPELQTMIREARKCIIYSYSWSADGVDIVIEHKDGSETTLPHYPTSPNCFPDGNCQQ